MKKERKIGEIKSNPNNPRVIKNDKFNSLKNSIKTLPGYMELRPVILDKDMMVLGGNMRLKASISLGKKEIWTDIFTEAMSEKMNLEATKDGRKTKTYLEYCDEIIIKDNTTAGEWEWDMLANEWDSVLLKEYGLDVWQNVDDNTENEITEHNKLSDTFVVPPFSILDTKKGYWQERKKYWKELIGDNGESREGVLAKGDTNIMSKTNNGVSLLDPVLAEIANKWFGLKNCNTFDCFAGDSVFGYVSDYLGNKFTGIELRQEQTDLNNQRLKGSKSKYICDDGQNVLKHIEENSMDLLFSCPPYFDLEVYSDLETDASNQKSYDDFIKIIDTAFTNSIKCLKDNRFAVIVVGDIRNKKGFYYGFPDDIKKIFIKNNMLLYNEMILAEVLGTLPQRVGRYMNNRKIGKCHQNILVFYKGDVKDIKKIYEKIEFKNLEIDESSDI